MAVVLITGCSSGFGKAAAIGFAEQGHQVVATMRNIAKADGLDVVPGVLVDALDIVDAHSRQACVARTLDRFGQIDVLVNNAGISALGPSEEMPNEIFHHQFDTNFFGPFELIKAVLPSMREHHTGRIVNVTSIGAISTSGFYSAYCATKHALDAISLGLDIELQQWGIRVTTVVPGGFTTSMAANRVREAIPADTIYARAQRTMDEYEDRMQGKTDLTPVVEAILAAAFDADPRARYLIGTGSAELLKDLVAEGERQHAIKRARDAL
jgi:NAD(P)-dependent dehydrogenase (short-subunit alcohol dehydrogenase family)